MDRLGAAQLARAASAPFRTVDTEGEKTGSSGEGGRAVLPLQNQQAGSPTCSWRHARGPTGTATGPVVRETEGVCECFISWHQHQP